MPSKKILWQAFVALQCGGREFSSWQFEFFFFFFFFFAIKKLLQMELSVHTSQVKDDLLLSIVVCTLCQFSAEWFIFVTSLISWHLLVHGDKHKGCFLFQQQSTLAFCCFTAKKEQNTGDKRPVHTGDMMRKPHCECQILVREYLLSWIKVYRFVKCDTGALIKSCVLKH